MKIFHKEIAWMDPFECFVRLRENGPSFIFESRGGNARTARYSFIGIDPKIIIKSPTPYTLHPAPSTGPFALIRHYLKRRWVPRIKGLPPFIGGIAGYFGYDVAHFFEELPRRAYDDLQLQDIVLMNVDTVAAFDHIEKRGWITSVADEDDVNGDGCNDRIISAEKRIKKERRILSPGRCSLKIKMVSNLTKKEYVDMVRRCKEYISSGDIFQANLSQRLSAYIKDIDPLSIYRILREVNPSPFSAFLDTGDMQIVSSSPERLVRLRNGAVETRPIAGTRPRGRDAIENGRLQEELLMSGKDRAEHIMLVDLERNDIGRVCRFGSIKVDEFMTLESYSHVTHIVSNVAGDIGAGKDAVDLIKAVFPGGTITGVPKIRCMEIIDELEPTTRGPYTGSLGYISFTGDMDLNIIIRTFIIKDGWAHMQVGAGIVADSDPEKEYYETLYKAEALLKTLELL
ncbi:MAG: anthranilate synthase component I family protein [Nitrospirae bacterium]|nr:anthranilate synthase component I family protein [Nitrospirota bacterium]